MFRGPRWVADGPRPPGLPVCGRMAPEVTSHRPRNASPEPRPRLSSGAGGTSLRRFRVLQLRAPLSVCAPEGQKNRAGYFWETSQLHSPAVLSGPHFDLMTGTVEINSQALQWLLIRPNNVHLISIGLKTLRNVPCAYIILL